MITTKKKNRLDLDYNAPLLVDSQVSLYQMRPGQHKQSNLKIHTYLGPAHQTYLGIKHVHVLDPSSRVNSSRVVLEQTKRERFRPRIALVREERIRINRKRRVVLTLKRQQTFQGVLQTRIE